MIRNKNKMQHEETQNKCANVELCKGLNASAFVSLFQIVRSNLEKKKALSEKNLASSRLGGSTVFIPYMKGNAAKKQGLFDE